MSTPDCIETVNYTVAPGDGNDDTYADADCGAYDEHHQTTPAAKLPYWRSSKLIEVLLCFVPVPFGVGLELGTPYERPIPYEQTDDGEYTNAVMFDFRKEQETVLPQVMFLVAIVIPLLLLLALFFWKRHQQWARTDPVHKIFCVYFMGIGWTQTLTNLGKLYVGYLRPIFYDYCQPNEDYQECTSESSHKGRVSFPSGHASMSVCGLLLFSFVLEDTFGVSSHARRAKCNAKGSHTEGQRKTQQEETEPSSWVRLGSVLCYAPMLVALFIVASRVHDNFHHPADVVGGALLGGSIAKLVFGIWYVVCCLVFSSFIDKGVYFLLQLDVPYGTYPIPAHSFISNTTKLFRFP